MPMVAGPASPTTERNTPSVPIQTSSSKPMLMAGYAVPKDAFLAWVRSEFAAANAIIDALCSHLAQLDTGSEYKAVFAAIHRRRLNWIPVLQMQKFHSIGDVTTELRKVAEEKKTEGEVVDVVEVEKEEKKEEKIIVGEKEELVEGDGNDDGGCCDGCEVVEEEESPDSDITDSG